MTVDTAGAGSAAVIAVGAAKGAAVGMLSGAASGAALGAVGHRLSTGSWDGAGSAALDGMGTGALSGAISGAVTGGLKSALKISQVRRGGACFVAGTPVRTSEGSIPIEQIQAGDYVWAWDEETGDVALKQVVETYLRETTELTHVFVDGEEIICTLTHPFYSPTKGWTDACKLRAGDILVLVNGQYVVVEKVQHELLETPVKVYNFQVEDYHTYYVADSGVLVHNSCNHNSKWAKERRSYWKNTATTVQEGKKYGAYTATQENISRMKRGLAPKGWDGYSVQLHHWKGIAVDFYDYSPVSRTLHQLIHRLE